MGFKVRFNAAPHRLALLQRLVETRRAEKIVVRCSNYSTYVLLKFIAWQNFYELAI